MNDLVLKKINNFVERCPEYIDGVTNVNDCRRLYEIVMAVRETKESVIDTQEALKNAIESSSKFVHAKHVVEDCMKTLDVIPSFLDYYLN